MTPAGPKLGHSRLGLLAIGLAVLAPGMDTSVNVALPAITAAFGLGGREIQWVVVCYMLTYGSLMLTCGKLGDLFGHRRILLCGLAICVVAFTLCASAGSYPALLGGRALQGVGVALAISCAPALATALYPESERTWVLSIYGATFAIGTALGPLLGSALVAAIGWSGVFAFRAPLVLLALGLAWWTLPGKPAEGASHRAAGPFDALGAGLLIAWMSALVLAFAGPHQVSDHWPDWSRTLPDGATLGWALAAFGLVSLAAFIAHEARAAEPIIRPGLFRQPVFAALNILTLLVNLASFATLLIVPYFLVDAARLPITSAGLVMAMSGFGMAAGSWATGRLSARVAATTLAFTGATGAGLLLLAASHWTPQTPVWLLALTLVGQGFGVGLFQVAYNDSVIATLPLHDRGVAGSLTMMVRTLGIIGGATGLSALFQHLERWATTGGLGREPAFLRAFEQTMALAGCGLLAGVAVALLLSGVWRRHRA